MDVANMEGGLVVGTGDLSELALGWATYNGDQMSMYGRERLGSQDPRAPSGPMGRRHRGGRRDARHAARHTRYARQPRTAACRQADGSIAQRTEDLVGPYELHDFFLYYFLRAGYGPAKLCYLAERAFAGSHDAAAVRKWLEVFFRRFFSQQFKRSAMPDGPKVGTVTLSPRGDWRMPSGRLGSRMAQGTQTL